MERVLSLFQSKANAGNAPKYKVQITFVYQLLELNVYAKWETPKNCNPLYKAEELPPASILVLWKWNRDEGLGAKALFYILGRACGPVVECSRFVGGSLVESYQRLGKWYMPFPCLAFSISGMSMGVKHTVLPDGQPPPNCSIHCACTAVWSKG